MHDTPALCVDRTRVPPSCELMPGCTTTLVLAEGPKLWAAAGNTTHAISSSGSKPHHPACIPVDS
jgi:hypothetical protein